MSQHSLGQIRVSVILKVVIFVLAKLRYDVFVEKVLFVSRLYHLLQLLFLNVHDRYTSLEERLEFINGLFVFADLETVLIFIHVEV